MKKINFNNKSMNLIIKYKKVKIMKHLLHWTTVQNILIEYVMTCFLI